MGAPGHPVDQPRLRRVMSRLRNRRVLNAVCWCNCTMHSGMTDALADDLMSPLDPRWITVQRIHGGIFSRVLLIPSFIGVIICPKGKGSPDGRSRSHKGHSVTFAQR